MQNMEEMALFCLTATLLGTFSLTCGKISGERLWSNHNITFMFTVWKLYFYGLRDSSTYYYLLFYL